MIFVFHCILNENVKTALTASLPEGLKAWRKEKVRSFPSITNLMFPGNFLDFVYNLTVVLEEILYVEYSYVICT